MIFTRFLAVGGLLAMCNIGVLWLLVDKARWPLLWACAASFLVLNFAGYVLNKFYAFRIGRQLESAELLRYYGVMGVSLAVNLGVMWMLVKWLHWHYLVASVMLTGALASLNYVAHRRVTFASLKDRTPVAAEHEGRGFPAHDAMDCNAVHVLQVSAFFPSHGGGIEAVAGQLAARLGRAGVRVHWMAGEQAEGAVGPPEIPNVWMESVRFLDPLERRLGLPAPIWAPAGVMALWRAIGKSHVVQIHDYLYFPSLLALLFAKLRSKPVVLTQHIGEIPFNSGVARLALSALNRSVGIAALRAADQVIFVSTPVQRYFQRIGRFARPPLLVPNGVDHDRYRPSEGAGARDQRRQVSLLFVGRFVEKKGLLVLRRCLTLSAARWTFVGWGPLPPVLSALERGDGFSDINILGQMPAADIVPHYQRADLLVLPSTGEGFPLVVQEALACGTPVLVSTEVYEAFPKVDERCVFDVELRKLTPAEAGLALRLKLEELVAQPALLREAREPARALACQWDWESCVGRYQEVYARLLRSPSAKTS